LMAQFIIILLRTKNIVPAPTKAAVMKK